MNHFRRLALIACISALALFPAWSQAPAPAQTETRVGALDMILLVDKSLSMAPWFDEAKAYLAARVIEPSLVPGDRLIVEAVYGRVDRLLSMKIGSEEDKAKAIRSIRSLRPDGHFTDLGAALDRAQKDLEELGQPDRPKYVLLLTDERQEAPKGSPYATSDYKLKHPSLEYIKREDLGKYRVITVGLQVKAKIDKTAPAVMELLMDAPVRSGARGGSEPGLAAPGGTAAETVDRGGLKGSGATSASGSQAAGSPAGGTGAATPAEKALPAWLLYGAAALLAAALAGLAVVLVLSKRKQKEKERATD